MSSTAADEYQLQRSRNGCLTCRTRRVKCDEGRPVCERCRVGGRDCAYGPDKPLNPRKRRRKVLGVSTAPSTPPNDRAASPPNAVAGPSTASAVHSTPSSSVALMAAVAATAPRAPIPPPAALTGDIDWISGRTRMSLMLDASLLSSFFPRFDEMATFRYYIEHAEDLIAFLGPYNQGGQFNPWVSIHAPLVFRHAPGICRTTDAIRTAIVAVGAVRLQYVDDPLNQRVAQRIATDARDRVLQLLRDILTGPERYPDEIEGALAAMLSCTVACTLAADNGWEDMLAKAVALIDRVGGAEKLCANLPKNQFSATRFVLEQLAVRDVIACMTLGRRPCILRQPFEPWFFEIERWSGKDVEWESIERQFGVTRGMVDVMARACSLIGVARERIALEGAASGNPPREIQDAANGLLAELQVWDHGFNYTPYHVRTQYGNHCYRHGMRIALMRDVLGLDQDNERIVSCAHAIIELARELDFEKGPSMNWLLWPLMLAGFHLGSDMEMRTACLSLLEYPGPHMCFDSRAGIRLLKEFWEQQDAHSPGQLSHWQVSNGELHRCLFAG